VLTAYREGQISSGRSAEMLLVSEPQLGELAALFGARLDYGA
jgi:hypothetical protein